MWYKRKIFHDSKPRECVIVLSLLEMLYKLHLLNFILPSIIAIILYELLRLLSMRLKRVRVEPVINQDISLIREIFRPKHQLILNVRKSIWSKAIISSVSMEVWHRHIMSTRIWEKKEDDFHERRPYIPPS